MGAAIASELPLDAVIGGKYRIVRVLGSGGMGAVYEAENTRTKRRVAVKVMHPEGAAVPDYARRFTLEAQAAGKISHDNVVEVIDMGGDPEGEGLFIVYEFLTGEDLRRRLNRRGRLDAREALEVVLPVMEALVTVHSHGIVHRDLKPENIFLAETQRGVVPKLIDFGIAKFSFAEAQVRTATGEMIGTPSYMSPEQILGESDIDGRADVWSIAVVLYEALSGHRPFKAESVGMFVTEVLTAPARPITEFVPDLDPALVRAIQQALLPRESRHASMGDFVAALKRVRADFSTLPGGETAADALAAEDIALPLSIGLSQPDIEPAKAAPVPTRVLTPQPSPWPPAAETPVPARTELPLRRVTAVAVLVAVAAVGWGVFAHRTAPTAGVEAPRAPTRAAAPAPTAPPATPTPAAPMPPTPAAAPTTDVNAPALAPAIAAPARRHTAPRRHVGHDAGAPRSEPGFVAE